MSQSFPLPIIDVSPLIAQTDAQSAVATQIHPACVATGFFYVTGHGISESLQQELEAVSRQFCALAEPTKSLSQQAFAFASARTLGRTMGRRVRSLYPAYWDRL